MSVTPADVAVELGRSTPDSATEIRWQSWIDQALYLIGKRLTIADLDPADVDYVVLQAVSAHVRNPDDATQVDVAVDDARVSRRYSSGKGRVVIPDDLWGVLDPDMANESGVGSTRLYGDPDTTTTDVWVNTTAVLP